MASTGLKIYRTVSMIWTGSGRGWLARFARSSAFAPAMLVILLVGTIGVVVQAGSLPSDPHPAALAAFQLVLVGFIVCWLLLFFSRGATATSRARHAEPADRLIIRCREILERRGFSVQVGAAATLEAIRGRFGNTRPSHGAEVEWRQFPLYVIASVVPDQPTTLEVACTGVGGIFQGARELTADTCDAIARLDDQAFDRLDGSLGGRQGGWLLGGLATTIFNVVLIASLLTAAIVAGVSYKVGGWALEVAEADGLRGSLGQLTLQLVSDMDQPLRTEVDRLSALLAKSDPEGKPPLASLRGLDASAVPGELVAGIRMKNDSVALALPGEASPLRAQLPDIFKEMRVAPRALYRAGDKVFRRLAHPYTRDLAVRLGVKPDHGELIIGTALTHGELARLAPRVGFNGLEMTFFESGRSFLRYAWPPEFGKAPMVDGGSATLPADVISALAQDREAFWTAFRQILFGGAMQGMVIRKEIRNESEHLVIYSGSERGGAGTGWSGVAVAQKYDPVFDPRKEILSLAVVVALVVILPILFITMIVALPVAARITRPVLRVRDTLRSIAEGDYSSRVDVTHTDEIGQLQKLLNHTAEELKKRESIKELMGKYLSKQVADRIMEGDPGQAIAGVRREVSVLFADVRGFTTYSEKHDPEQVTKSLNEYFEVMVDVIASHEGVLDKYIGDGLMVVFGAPMAQEDHARRAVDTALEMQAALQSLNLKRAQRGDDPIHIGIGVNTGLAISGNLGSLKRMEFTVIGDTVNTAARLESNAKQGQILIGRATFEKVKDLIECEPLGQITVKGKAEPVDVWWLKGLKPRKA
jgi:class 3 adenylate cyclase